MHKYIVCKSDYHQEICSISEGHAENERIEKEKLELDTQILEQKEELTPVQTDIPPDSPQSLVFYIFCAVILFFIMFL